MKTDVNGYSTTKPGEEQYEYYYAGPVQIERVQYDYRTPEGKLFSCTADDLKSARAKRDAWLKKQQ